MRKHLLLILFLTTNIFCLAQNYELELDYAQEELLSRSDYSLYTQTTDYQQDIFTKLSNYNFSAQRYLRRGLNYNYTSGSINSISLNDAFSPYPYFSLQSIARNLRTQNNNSPNAYSTKASDCISDNRATISYVNRNSPITLRALYHGTSNSDKYSYLAFVEAKFGRDSQIDGLWGEYYSAGFSLDRKLSDNHLVSAFASVSYNNYSSRTATTAEVYELTENPLYNSSWGYFEGKKMSARINTQLQPSLMLTHQGTLSPSTKIETSALYIFTKKSYNSLSWDDASSPYPDYYQWLPSFLDEGTTKELITSEWKNNNTDLTQIDWNQIMQTNQNSGEQALYFMSKRVQDKNDFTIKSTATTNTKYNLTLNYGAEYQFSSNNKYRIADNLLGCEYLLDDYGNKISEGEQYDYNVNFYSNKITAYASALYKYNKLSTSLDIELANQTYHRVDNAKSRKINFNPYNISLSGSYSLNSMHKFEGRLTICAEAPYSDDIFCSPYYSNNIIDNPTMKTSLSAEINYSVKYKFLRAKISLYHTSFKNETTSYSYYDDIYEQYSTLILSSLDSKRQGIELASEFSLAHGWSISTAFALNKYVYTSNATANIYAQDSGEKLDVEQTSYTKGYLIANTPQTVASLELKYSSSYNLIVSLTLSHTSGSYVEINPLRRTAKIAEAAYYSELKDELTTQEKLSGSTTLSLFIYKGFKIAGHEFYATLNISNLLGSKIIYSGYEQMRLNVEGSGASTYYTPYDNKYLYSYSRTFRVNLGYKF